MAGGGDAGYLVVTHPLQGSFPRMARLWVEQTTNQALIKQRGPRTCSWREVTLASRSVPEFLVPEDCAKMVCLQAGV